MLFFGAFTLAKNHAVKKKDTDKAIAEINGVIEKISK